MGKKRNKKLRKRTYTVDIHNTAFTPQPEFSRIEPEPQFEPIIFKKSVKFCSSQPRVTLQKTEGEYSKIYFNKPCSELFDMLGWKTDQRLGFSFDSRKRILVTKGTLIDFKAPSKKSRGYACNSRFLAKTIHEITNAEKFKAEIYNGNSILLTPLEEVV